MHFVAPRANILVIVDGGMIALYLSLLFLDNLSFGIRISFLIGSTLAALAVLLTVWMMLIYVDKAIEVDETMSKDEIKNFLEDVIKVHGNISIFVFAGSFFFSVLAGTYFIGAIAELQIHLIVQQGHADRSDINDAIAILNTIIANAD